MVFLNHKELADLVIKARSGDSQAFEKLYEHTAPVQYYQLRQIMDDPVDAQDALQEVYVLLYQNLNKIQTPGALVAYLNRLSYNVGMNMNRSVGKFHNRIVEIDKASSTPDPDINLCGRLEKEENKNLIENTLNDLPEQERFIVTQRYFQKQTLSQIAYSMDTSLSTVKRLHRSAKKRLKLLLEKQGNVYWGFLGPRLSSIMRESVSSLRHPPLSPPGDRTAEGALSENVTAVLPKPHPIAMAAGTVAVKSALMLTALSGAAAAGTALMPAPALNQLTLPSEYTAAPAEISFTLDSKSPVKQVRIVNENHSSKNTSLPVQSDGSGSYRAFLSENGSYILEVSAVGGKTMRNSFHMDKIDTVPPKLISIVQEGGVSTAIFQDDESGIDPAALYCSSDSGIVTLPEKVDEKQGKAIFRLPKENNTLYFADKAGNVCTTGLEFEDSSQPPQT